MPGKTSLYEKKYIILKSIISDAQWRRLSKRYIVGVQTNNMAQVSLLFLRREFKVQALKTEKTHGLYLSLGRLQPLR